MTPDSRLRIETIGEDRRHWSLIATGTLLGLSDVASAKRRAVAAALAEAEEIVTILRAEVAKAIAEGTQ